MFFHEEFLQVFSALVCNIQFPHCCCVAAMCAGHGFPARHVIHINSPTWKYQGSVQQLETAVVSILKLADEEKLKVLAVPSISSGQSVDPVLLWPFTRVRN